MRWHRSPAGDVPAGQSTAAAAVAAPAAVRGVAARRGSSDRAEARSAGRRGRRTWPQRLALAAGCVTVVGLTASATGLAYIYRKYERLPRVELSGVLDVEEESGRPENYLIVGVDNASRLPSDDPVRRGRDQTSRSDTIMILRIDPASEQAALLSLPRDLWIPIPGTGSSQRINSTIQRGGPELLIRTIDEDFGIPIHHYVQIDFAAFRGLVDAVDGVPVYVPRPARDRQSGLSLPERGCVTLDPTQALAYVRSRHYEELVDGEWEEDARSDLGRIDRQQDFIRRALTRAIDRGARNLRKLDQLIDVALDGITVDDGLTADDIFRLGDDFRSFQPEDLATYAVPTVGDYVGEASILRLVEEEAEPIFDIFRGNPEAEPEPGGRSEAGAEPPARGASDIPPSSILLQVLNGSGRSGEAAGASSDLRAAGFQVVGTGEAATFDDDPTVVQYPQGQADAARTVARWLGSGADLEEVPGSAGIVVITGADWAGVRSAPSAPPTTSSGSRSTTTTALSATTSTLATTTTTSPGAGSARRSSASTTTTLDPAAREC